EALSSARTGSRHNAASNTAASVARFHLEAFRGTAGVKKEETGSEATGSRGVRPGSARRCLEINIEVHRHLIAVPVVRTHQMIAVIEDPALQRDAHVPRRRPRQRKPGIRLLEAAIDQAGMPLEVEQAEIRAEIEVLAQRMPHLEAIEPLPVIHVIGRDGAAT